MTTPCPLCDPIDAPILWQCDQITVIDAREPDYPGFCRVLWRAHRTEMTQLTPAERQRLMTVVFAVEQALIDHLRPDKINLGSLGNQVAHLHWHVIPRFKNDCHFPDAIWAPARRNHSPTASVTREQLRQWLNSALDNALGPII
ncbi:MAG: HIT family protein [Gammaproteobacteria bacterium]